jgi:hypothetical protein
MRTLLRHTETGLYFKGTERWTPSPAEAYDFRFIERAREFVRTWELEKVEVTFDFELAAASAARPHLAAAA